MSRERVEEKILNSKYFEKKIIFLSRVNGSKMAPPSHPENHDVFNTSLPKRSEKVRE